EAGHQSPLSLRVVGPHPGIVGFLLDVAQLRWRRSAPEIQMISIRDAPSVGGRIVRHDHFGAGRERKERGGELVHLGATHLVWPPIVAGRFGPTFDFNQAAPPTIKRAWNAWTQRSSSTPVRSESTPPVRRENVGRPGRWPRKYSARSFVPLGVGSGLFGLVPPGQFTVGAEVGPRPGALVPATPAHGRPRPRG